MFLLKKTSEHRGPSKPPPKKEKKKPSIEGEKINDKFSILNDIDNLLS